jgi:hypothetical protein
VEVCIRATGQPGPDELRSLAVVLREGDVVDGAIGFAGEPLAADRLGPWLDVITVAVGAGGAVTVLIREVTHYLLRRTSDLDLEVSQGPDGPRFRLSAKRLRVMSPDQVEEVIRQAARALGAGSSPGHATDRAALSGPDAPDRRGQDREEGTGEERRGD